MNPDLTTKEGAESFVDYALRQARVLFDRSGRVWPMATLLATRSAGGISIPPGEVGLLTLVSTDVDADAMGLFSVVIRTNMLATKAIGVLFVAEMWMVETATEAEAERLKSQASIAKEPSRKEILWASFEHVRTSFIMEAAIERPESGPPKLGAFERHPFDELGGRFSNLLDRSQFP